MPILLAVVFSLQILSSSMPSVLAVQSMQLLALIFLSLPAIRWRFFAPKSANPNSQNGLSGLDLPALYFIYILPAQSVVGIILTSAPDISLVTSVAQTIIFFFALLMVRWLIVFGPPTFLYSAAVALIFLAGLLAVSSFTDLLAAISGSSNEVTGRIRFAPFGNHPNLIGHTFGVGAILCLLFLRFSADPRHRTLFACGLMLSILIVLGTVSRGAALATGMGIATALLASSKAASARLVRLAWALLFATGISVFLAVEYWSTIATFLELDTAQRGIGSGGSGRADVWSIVVQYSFADPITSVVGNGLRTWPTEQLGVSTDSSFLNSLWELGLVGLLILGLCLAYRLKQINELPYGPARTIILSLFVFAITEGFVARYLLAVGNPASLILLMIFVASPRACAAWITGKEP